MCDSALETLDVYYIEASTTCCWQSHAHSRYACRSNTNRWRDSQPSMPPLPGQRSVNLDFNGCGVCAQRCVCVCGHRCCCTCRCASQVMVVVTVVVVVVVGSANCTDPWTTSPDGTPIHMLFRPLAIPLIESTRGVTETWSLRTFTK